MKQIFLLITISLLLFSCSGGDNGKKEVTASSETKKPAEKEIDGSKVYKQYCITCHGIAGDMGASGAFDLTKSKLTLEEKIGVITNGRNTMTPFKGLLSEKKIEAVAAFTETLKKAE